MTARGQSLVEFALVMPLLAATLLAFAEAGFLFSTAHTWQRSLDVLADSAAVRVAVDPDWRSGWDALVDEEQARTGCGEPTVTFPDGTVAGGRVSVAWTCIYDTKIRGPWPHIEATYSSTAIIPLAPVP